ncbi:DUF397 domain-containing protein, partial [Streptomyces sp. CC77]|uniref:DUF397 domain-containing protein n=1 Tax=Streptomyces sp. CC77 TaxID=1906739 RepID=UPI0015878CC6
MTPLETSSLEWRKSSHSGGSGDDRLEVADGQPGMVPARDSKTPDGPELAFRAGPWNTFVAHGRRPDTPEASPAPPPAGAAGASRHRRRHVTRALRFPPLKPLVSARVSSPEMRALLTVEWFKGQEK